MTNHRPKYTMPPSVLFAASVAVVTLISAVQLSKHLGIFS